MKKNFFIDKTKKKIKEKRFYIVLAFCLLTISTIAFTNSILEKPNAPAENKNSDVKYALPEPIGEPESENEIITQTFPPQNETPVEDYEPEENQEKESEISVENDTDYNQTTAEKENDSLQQNESFPAATEVQKTLRKITPPVPGEILLPFSNTPAYQKTTEDWRTHEAIDYSVDTGYEIAAAGSGKILKISDSGLYGASIIIDHGNTMKTLYANVSAAEGLKEGDFVTTGDIIGFADNTSLCEKYDKPHIHFEVMINDKNVNPNEWLE